LRTIDQFVVGALLTLIVVSPFAFGSVHPWAYRPLEAVLFALAIFWMVKIAALAGSSLKGDEGERDARAIEIPLVIVAAYVIFQMTPLPPAMVRALSPGTYDLYSHALKGWPASRPYDDLESDRPVAIASADASRTVILPSVDEVKAGAPIPFMPATAKPAPTREAASPVPALAARIYGGRWRPLAIAPLLTLSSLLGLLSCMCAFLVTAFYPLAYGDDSEATLKFIRVSVRVILVTGFLVAFVGLIERATWNGKMLWFFVPYDWGHPIFEPLLRARGPFIDPDHFGGYLAMIFPLALACAIFPNLLTPRRAPLAFRIQCGAASFVIFLAILLSLSRAGWIALILGTIVMSVLAAPRGVGDDPKLSPVAKVGGVRLAIAGIVVLLGASMIFIGPEARVDTFARVDQSAAEMETIVGRIEAWKGGLALIRDFPIFGVGLGGWPEVFARYQLPPWQVLFFAQAHNDYIQLLAETGIVGIALYAWLAVSIVRKIVSGARTMDAAAGPIFAALIAGIVAAGVVEFFDFDLRIPALAVLFAVFAGLLVRLTAIGSWAPERSPSRPWAIRVRAVAVSIAALVLLAAALNQDAVVYPYDLTQPDNFKQARALLVTFPANVYPHLWLINLEAETTAPAALDAELKRSVWLSPLDPATRDLYAQSLINSKRYDDAFAQVEASVRNSPGFDQHRYLVPSLIPWLPLQLKTAIEKGLNEAVDRDYPHAPENLGYYYETVGQFSAEGHAFARVADRQDDPEKRAKYLQKSGEAFARGGAFGTALITFRQAAESAPDDSSIYADMATMVYGPRHDMDGARQAIEQGIENGADSFELNVALANAALAAGDRHSAEDALERALTIEPNSGKLLLQLGEIYQEDNRPDRALLALNRALEIEPDSASTYFAIGNIQEDRYQYYEAERAYRRAVELSPDNTKYRDHLAEFEHKLKAAAAADATETKQ
jgi:O-antigen ligase/tetratricopeptide (TPR) repeat protein